MGWPPAGAAFGVVASSPICLHHSAVPLLPLHQAHNNRVLISRWRAVAREAGLRGETFATVLGEPLIFFQSRAAQAGSHLVYLSTGVHGDEPGAAWGLLHWAENHVETLRSHPFLIFPCLNPIGLRLNTRADHRGLDINRRFHMDDDEICGPWRKVMQGRRFKVGVCLHEDYDAQGSYVYELSREKLPLSRDLLGGCTRWIPLDLRRKIDGRASTQGIIRRRTVPPDLPGMPEAIELHRLGCAITLTFETPSEFSLDDRVRTHAAFVSAVVERFQASPQEVQP